MNKHSFRHIDRLATLFLCLLFLNVATTVSADEWQKPRIIITCDPECDDNNSLIHFLLRSNEFDIDGIVYASSRYHWKGNGTAECRHITETSYLIKDFGYANTWRWSEGFIEDIVDAYAQCYDNLKVHDANYPDPDDLKSVIRYGNIDFEGDYSADTPGSDLIKECILDNDTRTLYVTVWGGASTVARALKSIEEEYGTTATWETIRQKVIDKLVICMPMDQDGSYPCYIQPVWPDVRILRKGYNGINIGYYPQLSASEDAAPYYYPAWMSRNISSKGPLGSLTRVWGDGKQMVPGDACDCFGEANKTQAELKDMGYADCWFDTQPKGAFLGEGNANTCSWLNLIDNGLRAIEDPTWGGWAGRAIAVSSDISADLNSIYVTDHDSVYDVLDILPVYFNSLATRYSWSVTPNYADANHYPVINAPLTLNAKAGKTISVKATATDPDGDKLSLKWIQFKVGTYSGDVTISNDSKATAKVYIPSDAQPGQTIHLILTATDDSELPLTRYHRVVITVI